LTHLLVTGDKFTKWIEARPLGDKFTKWIEARPLAKISSKQAVCFVQDIIFRFRVPNSIITDNNT
jgi:hypothetical protein